MANTYIYQMTDTWANATQEFVAINMNVTDTASTANSALINLSVGGANQFTVLKSGDVFAAGGLGANTTHTNLLGDGIVIDYSPAGAMGRIMVGAGDGFTFYSGNATNVGANNVMLTISNTGVTSMGNTVANVQLGGITTAGTPAVVTGSGNSNSSVSMIVTNANTGGNTSADFAAYDGGGLAGVNFIDMGITGNTWSNAAWTVGGPSDGYLYTGNTNLSIGTAGGTGSNGFINFFTNGTLIANERMRITPGGNVGIGNTAPDATFKVTGTANISGNVIVTQNVTSNFLIGSTGLAIGTTTANSIANTTALRVANATAYSNVGLATIQTTAGQIMVGNLATTNAVVNTSGMFAYGNSTNYIAETSANATVLAGNATVYSAINATSIVTSGNTLTLGSSTKAANGTTWLPNGLKANWGWVSANSTDGNATFTSAFATACLSVMVTAANSLATGPYTPQAANTTVALIRTTSATSGNVAFFAIGY